MVSVMQMVADALVGNAIEVSHVNCSRGFVVNEEPRKPETSARPDSVQTWRLSASTNPMLSTQ